METVNPCTILIPASHLAKLRALARSTGGWRPLLGDAVRFGNSRFRRRIVRRSLVRYQRRGRNLIRVGFRPVLDDWLELGQLALVLGASRCLVFIILSRILLRKRPPIRGRGSPLILLTRLENGTLCRGPLELFAADFRSEIGKEISNRHIP